MVRQRSKARKRELAFSQLGSGDPQESRNRLDAIEYDAASIDHEYRERARRAMPGCDPEKPPAQRGTYDWLGTELAIFAAVPFDERRVCAEWLRGVRQTDIARRCKIKLRTVRRIVAAFRGHLSDLGRRGRISVEDLEEYWRLLGRDPAMIARIKRNPPKRNVPYTVLHPTRAVSIQVADELPEDVYQERLARHAAILARLERDRHGTAVIDLPPLGHRKKLRRRTAKR